jgi:hypothetical protein
MTRRFAARAVVRHARRDVGGRETEATVSCPEEEDNGLGPSGPAKFLGW